MSSDRLRETRKYGKSHFPLLKGWNLVVSFPPSHKTPNALTFQKKKERKHQSLLPSSFSCFGNFTAYYTKKKDRKPIKRLYLCTGYKCYFPEIWYERRGKGTVNQFILVVLFKNKKRSKKFNATSGPPRGERSINRLIIFAFIYSYTCFLKTLLCIFFCSFQDCTFFRVSSDFFIFLGPSWTFLFYYSKGPRSIDQKLRKPWKNWGKLMGDRHEKVVNRFLSCFFRRKREKSSWRSRYFSTRGLDFSWRQREIWLIESASIFSI